MEIVMEFEELKRVRTLPAVFRMLSREPVLVALAAFSSVVEHLD